MTEQQPICRLVALRDGAVVSVYDMTAPSVVVGRGRECDFRIESTTVSRRHIVIEARNGAVMVRDLGSRNGTYLQDRLLREEVFREDATLRVGTELELRIEFPRGPLAAVAAGDAMIEAAAPRPSTEQVAVPGAPAPPAPPPEMKIVCPHCWASFEVSDILAVARHQELAGDAVLGPEAAQRFLPSRFTPEGHALDAHGMTCPEMACPRCHLVIPRDLLDKPPVFLSIIGAPASGKSYLLTTMTWELRSLMPRAFAFGFADADSTCNQIVNEYERTLFLAADDEAWVTLEKTEMHGRLYDEVRLDNMRVSLPRPFMFSLRPQPHHPWADRREDLTQTLVLYDNAGEHFEPGADSAANPGTQHLAHSRGLIFLFDPTKDSRFRARCQSDDPQLKRGARVERQEILLKEAFDRIRSHGPASRSERYPHPLIVAVTKYDIWRDLLRAPLEDPWKRVGRKPTCALDTDAVMAASMAVRHLLAELCPELVATAEAEASRVFYIPVSALGHSPTEDPDNPGSGFLMVRPRDVQPVWAAVPMLTLLSVLGMIPALREPRAEGLPAAEDCRLYGDKVLFTVPESGVEIETSQAYLGRVMRCPVSGVEFWIPTAREIGARRAADDAETG